CQAAIGCEGHVAVSRDGLVCPERAGAIDSLHQCGDFGLGGIGLEKVQNHDLALGGVLFDVLDPEVEVARIAEDIAQIALALIVATEPRARLEAAPWRAAVPRQPVQEPQAFPIKPAKGPLLQAISDHSPQQVLAQICWWGSSEDHAPVSPKRVKRKRAQMSNLGLDHGRVCRVPPHGYALGTLVASAEALPATIPYTRSPAVFSRSSLSLSPSFLRTTAARKARTVCGCQPVERVTVAMVAPLGPHSSASTRACFEFARPVG